MKLSIIVAVSGEASKEQLNDTLQSLEGQLGGDTELIVIDCSLNKEIADYIKGYSGAVKSYIIDEDVNLGGAFNKGLRVAEGEFVTFLTAGDITSDNFVKAMTERAVTKKCDVVSCGYTYSDGSEADEINNSKQNGEMDEANRCAAIVNPGPYFAKIYKKSLFDDNGIWFIENSLCPGDGVVTLVLMYCNHLEYVEENLLVKSLSVPDEHAAEDYANDMIMNMDFFMQECYKRELIEEYPEEVEYRYTVKGYLEPLFAYMDIKASHKVDMGFVKFIRDTFTETFPDFDTNSYYMALIDEETADLVELHMTSPRKFVKVYSRK